MAVDNINHDNITGILLAAGSSSRFGTDKRLININDQIMVIASAKKLKNALPNTHVVIAAHDDQLKEILEAQNIDYILCENSEQGIGASIACAVHHTTNASAWILALSDMPFICSTTYTALLQEIRQGASICAPAYQGQRGHPVGFQHKFKQELMSLHSDKGAREIIENHREQLLILEVNDPGILVDIDTRQDLEIQTQKYTID